VKRYLILLALCGAAFGQTLTVNLAGAGFGTVTGSGQTYQNINLYTSASWLLCTYNASQVPPFCAGGTGIPSPPATGPTTGISSPSLSGSAAEFTLSGPNSTNTGWYQNFGASDSNTTFVLDEYIYIPTASLALMNDFERDQFQYLHSGSSGLTINSRYYWGTHCVLHGGDWFVWNSFTAAWVDTGASCSGVTANTWHHLVETVHRVPGDSSGSSGYGKMYFDSIVWDGTNVCGGSCPTTSAGALPAGYAEQTGIMLETDILTAGTVNVYDDEINETQSGAPGIACPGMCSASFGSGASVTLAAAANSGSSFGGWSGACSGSGSCVVAMTSAQSVTATFKSSGGGGHSINGVTCGPPTYSCSYQGTNTVQTPNTPPITSPLSSGMNCVAGTANGSGNGLYNSVGYDTSLNPLGLNPITRLTDNCMGSGYPFASTASGGDNDSGSNCAQRGVTPGSVFTTTICAITNTYFITLTLDGCPYVEALQVINSQIQVVAPISATKGPGFTTPVCGDFSWSHTNPAITYNTPSSGVPTIYQTTWTWSGVPGTTVAYSQTSLYNLQTLCPLPASFSTTWASSTSSDITDQYFTLALSNTGGQNTGVYMVFLDTTSATPTCAVYVTGGTTSAAGTMACNGANCPPPSALASFAPGCLFTIHDVFMLQNAANGFGYIPLSTGGQTSGHTCVTDKPVWQPYGPQLLQGTIKGTKGGLVFTGGHYSTGYNNIGVINNPYFYSVPASGVMAVSDTLTVAINGSPAVQGAFFTTPLPLGSIGPGSSLVIDTGANQETVSVISILNAESPPVITFFNAIFLKNHPRGVTITNIATPFTTFSLNCENHFSQQNANPAETNPIVGSSASNNYTTSSLTSTYPATGGQWFNEVYVAGGILGSTVGRITHNFILGEGNTGGCGTNDVGPFDNGNTNFDASQAIGDVTQDGAIFWWSSSFLGQLGTDALGNPYAAIFAVGLDMTAGSGGGSGGGTGLPNPPPAPVPWFTKRFDEIRLAIECAVGLA
jgi:Divergent InlB B-repeat domain